MTFGYFSTERTTLGRQPYAIECAEYFPITVEFFIRIFFIGSEGSTSMVGCGMDAAHCADDLIFLENINQRVVYCLLAVR